MIERWHVYVAFLCVNSFACLWNCYSKALPWVAKVSLATTLISWFVIMVTVPAAAKTHENARFVFANFVNATGWSQNGIGMLDFFFLLDCSVDTFSRQGCVLPSSLHIRPYALLLILHSKHTVFPTLTISNDTLGMNPRSTHRIHPKQR